VAQKGGCIKAIRVPGGAAFSRKELDDLVGLARAGGQSLAWAKINPEGWQSPLAKFFKEEERTAIDRILEAQPGDLLLFQADIPSVVHEVLAKSDCIWDAAPSSKDRFEFTWVLQFPLLEYRVEEGRYGAMHHPFTSPLEEDLPILESQPEKVRSRAYDLVLNGNEIGAAVFVFTRGPCRSAFSMS